MNYSIRDDCICKGEGSLAFDGRPLDAAAGGFTGLGVIPCHACVARYDATHCWRCDAPLDATHFVSPGPYSHTSAVWRACGPGCCAGLDAWAERDGGRKLAWRVEATGERGRDV